MSSPKSLEGFRSHVGHLVDSGVPLGRALESGRKYFSHPLIDPFAENVIEIRNEMIAEFGAQDVFREAYRQFRAVAESPEITEAYSMVGPPGAGKSTLTKLLKKPGLVIFDSAGATPGARAGVIGICRENDVPVHAVLVTTSLDECLERNAGRLGPKIVPPAVIARAYDSIHSLPPTRLEGFASILTY